MYLKHLKITNFRSLTNLDLEFDKINVFLGDNAMGKTSILEAIYYLAYTKSFKSDYKQVVNFNENFIKLIGNSNKRLELIDTQTKTKLLVDDIIIPRKTDYIGNLLVLLYSPTDNALVNADPSSKRKFINMTYGMLDQVYLDELNRYNKLLKQRNVVLKEKNDLILLDIITIELVKLNDIIQAKRANFISKINEIIKDIHLKLSSNKESLEIEYITTNDLKSKLKETLEYDMQTGTTNHGIHRDNLKFKINGIDASFASTGQIRSILLSLNLALVEIIKDLKDYPLLLLDDSFNEIDRTRMKNFIDLLDDNVQVFITGTESNIIYDIMEHMKVFYMSNGMIIKEERR